MEALLLRVGVDKGTGGGLAPIYEDGSFDYIPIPEYLNTSESRTFRDLESSTGEPFSDFLDTEVVDQPIHLDPEFETYTYGDPTRKRDQLRKLNEGDLLIFYAGLQPQDYDDNPRLFVIGYFTVDTVHDLEEMIPRERQSLFERIPNNAHVKRQKVTPTSSHPDKDSYPVIVEGVPEESQLLDHARPLSDAFVAQTNPQYHMVDSVSNLMGYSVEKDLTRAVGRWLSPRDEVRLRKWLDDGTVGLVDGETVARTYVLRHDTGFAPNVRQGYCTLATCKKNIRTSAKIGDWVIGTGSLTRNDLGERLLYAMRVEEVFTFDEYYEDSRFEYKKPLTGELRDPDGDNIYYTDSPLGGQRSEGVDGEVVDIRGPSGDRFFYVESEGFVQLDNRNHSPSEISHDTPADPHRKAVLVSRQFWYFGEKEVLFPSDEELRSKLIKGYPGSDGKQGEKYVEHQATIQQFVQWLVNNYRVGVHGAPRDADETEGKYPEDGC